MEYVKNFRTYIDIGAGDGNACTEYVSKFTRVYAFEPNPVLNILIPNTIKMFPYALGDLNKEVIIKDGTRQYVIDQKTLDEFRFTTVDVIKINTGEFDLQVLKGAIQTILKSKPVILVNNNKLVVDFLKNLKYNIIEYNNGTVAYYE